MNIANGNDDPSLVKQCDIEDFTKGRKPFIIVRNPLNLGVGHRAVGNKDIYLAVQYDNPNGTRFSTKDGEGFKATNFERIATHNSRLTGQFEVLSQDDITTFYYTLRLGVIPTPKDAEYIMIENMLPETNPAKWWFSLE